MSDRLQPGSSLTPGQNVLSSNGNAQLAFQADGNLVLYVKRSGSRPPDGQGDWSARWASNTGGKHAATCDMQGDGNLVLYTKDRKVVWQSHTNGQQGASLVVQDDENAVIYNRESHPVWSSNTWISPPKRSAFVPGRDGFRFINNFPDGHWNIGIIRFATSGLCGGMTFTALDFFHAKRTVPSRRDTPSADHDPLGNYLNSRQEQSVTTNMGGWSTQVLNPDDHALNHWSTHDEWAKMKTKIDQSEPVSIGLGKYLNAGDCHQIVVSGYQEGARERWLLTYDPNNPGNESFVHLAPGRLHWSDEQNEDWRGFFVTSYVPHAPPNL